MISHGTAGLKEYYEPGREDPSYYMDCSCGHRGVLWASPEAAIVIYCAHIEVGLREFYDLPTKESD